MNATKYEAVAFVDDVTRMVQGGTYLLTIEVIATTLDTTKVQEFITNIIGTGTENVDFQGVLGALVNQVVLRTRNPIPPGNHSFTVSLQPFSFILPGPFTTLEREVELWILPPARRFAQCQCMSSYIHSILAVKTACSPTLQSPAALRCAQMVGIALML